MKYTKIRHVEKTGETELKWTSEDAEHGDQMVTKLESTDAPEPEFPAALQSLKPYMISLLELPEEYGEGMEVRSVTFRHKEGSWGAVLHATKDIEASNSPLNISTPYLRQSADGQTEGVGLLPIKMEEAIKILMQRADDFRKHNRAQGELALTPDEEEATEEPEPTPIEAAAAEAETEEPEEEPQTEEAETEDEPKEEAETEEAGLEEIHGGPLDGHPIVEHRGGRVVLPFNPGETEPKDLENELAHVYQTVVIDALEAVDPRAITKPIYDTRRSHLAKHVDQNDPIKNPGAIALDRLRIAIANLPPLTIRATAERDPRPEAADIYDGAMQAAEERLAS